MSDKQAIDRRTVVAGAAWSVPAIVVASAAPAHAVSPVTPPTPVVNGRWFNSTGGTNGSASSPQNSNAYYRVRMAVNNSASGSISRTVSVEVSITPPAGTTYRLSSTASDNGGGQDIKADPTAGGDITNPAVTTQDAPWTWGTVSQQLTGSPIALSSGSFTLNAGQQMPIKLDLVGSPSTGTKFASATVTLFINGVAGTPVNIV